MLLASFLCAAIGFVALVVYTVTGWLWAAWLLIAAIVTGAVFIAADIWHKRRR